MKNQGNPDMPNSPEMVAYLLFDRITQADDRLQGTRVSRTILLDLYAECLEAVRGGRARRERSVAPVASHVA